MTAEMPAPARGADAAQLAARAPRTPQTGFTAALARALAEAGSALERPGASRGGAPGLAPAPADLLARLRRGLDEGASVLRARRDEAEPAAAACAERAAPQPAGAQEPEAARALVSPAALERLAVEAGRLGDRAFVDLRLGSDLAVRLARGPGGIELLLEPAPGLRRAADAELPGLVAALRARGVAVSRAEVRPPGGEPAAGRPALTGGRGSDTRAATRQSGGTVAKW